MQAHVLLLSLLQGIRGSSLQLYGCCMCLGGLELFLEGQGGPAGSLWPHRGSSDWHLA